MNKKTIIIIGALVLAIVVVGIMYFLNKKTDKKIEEIEPQEEISDEQMRTTLVTLYYQNKDTKELSPEGRMVDVKELLKDPYATLVKLLIEGPKSEKLQSAIPDGTKILNAELKGDIVYLDLSNEFIDKHEGGKESENNTIYSIVNTLTELNEVNGVKILINGQQNKSFKDDKINFKDVFIRQEKIENNKNK